MSDWTITFIGVAIFWTIIVIWIRGMSPLANRFEYYLWKTVKVCLFFCGGFIVACMFLDTEKSKG